MKCEHDKVLTKTDEYYELDWSDNLEKVELTVELDSRGYIRLINDGQNNCIDTDYNFEINFCPICGEKFKKVK